MIVPYMERKEAYVEGKEAYIEERTCIEENRSLSRSMKGWDKGPGKLRCCFKNTLVFTFS